jgi:hypothetical protein
LRSEGVGDVRNAGVDPAFLALGSDRHGRFRPRRLLVAVVRAGLLAMILSATIPLFAFVAADEKPKPACALIKTCGLTPVVSACTVAQSRPVEGVTYDAARRDEPRDLLAHGIAPAAGIGAQVHDFLGRRYRVAFDVKGEAPISLARFGYLADDLPLAAKLASKLSKTRYVMTYLGGERRRFHAERAEKLTGDAEMLFFDEAAKQRTYFGWGTSKFGPWKLRGSAYVDLRVRQSAANPHGIAYDLRIRTAPVNAVVNAIMKMGIFKGHVVGQIEDTMKDLVGAAALLTPTNLEKILTDPAFAPDERERLRAFAAIP